MKKLTFMLSALCLLVIVSCSKDTEINEPTSVNPNFRVTEYTAKGGETNHLGNKVTEFDVSTLGSACYTTDLVAGQNQIAGDVSVYNAGVKMYIVYTTSGDWALKNTHLSVGNCIETIPTTGSGNPKVGQFEKTWEFVSYSNTDDVTSDVIQVVYEFDQAAVFASVIPTDPELGDYCFAAHAVVQAGTNETAWAGSLTPDTADLGVRTFEGNNWAMLIRGDFGDSCTSGGDTE